MLLALSFNPTELSIYVDSVNGQDHAPGSLEYPLKTLEAALGKIGIVPHQTIIIWLFPGVYPLPPSGISNLESFQIRGCLNCTTGVEVGEKATTLQLIGPSANQLEHTISATDSNLSFFDLTITPLIKPDSSPKLCNSPILAQQSNLTFTRVTFTRFELTEQTSRLATIVASASGVRASFFEVTWSSNIIKTEAIPAITAVLDSHLAFVGTQADTLIVVDSLVVNNSVTLYQASGGIFGATANTLIMRTRFLSNVLLGNISSAGAAISALSGTIVIDSCYFYNNSAALLPRTAGDRMMSTESQGGAISASMAIKMPIFNCTFEKNQAEYGGALSLTEEVPTLGGDVRVQNCTFFDNYAHLGSAIYGFSGGKNDLISLHNVILHDNRGPIGSTELGLYAPCAVFIREIDVISFHNITLYSKEANRAPHTQSNAAHRLTFSRILSLEIAGIVLDGITTGPLDGDVMLVQDSEEMHVGGIEVLKLSTSLKSGSIVDSWFLFDADADITIKSSRLYFNNLHLGTTLFSTSSPILHVRNTEQVHIDNFNLRHLTVSPERPLIFVHNAKNFTITECHISETSGPISIQDTEVIQIYDSSFLRMNNVLPTVDISFSTSVLITNVSFDWSKSQALRITDTEAVVLLNNVFRDCEASDQDGGAAFFSSVSRNTISFCTFERCRSANGGAIYSWDALAMDHCSFTNNSATLAGGAVYIAEGHSQLASSTFTGNTAPSGGAVYFEGSDYLVFACNFTRNEAASGTGGAILANGRSSTIVQPSYMMHSTFTSNYARTSGGAISAVFALELYLTSCHFDTNVAGPREIFDLKTYPISDFQPVFGLGGAVHVVGRLKVESCTFYSNLANAGGALYLQASPSQMTLFLIGSNFTSNLAAHSGGALLVDSLPMLAADGVDHEHSNFTSWLEGTNFTGNIALYNGGAVSMLGLRLNLTCGNNGFFNNSAKFGGAFHHDHRFGPSPGLPDVYSQIFHFNTALSGAIAHFNRLHITEVYSYEHTCRTLNSCLQNRATGYATVYSSGYFYLAWLEPIPGFKADPTAAPNYEQPPVHLPPYSFKNSACSEQRFPLRGQPFPPPIPTTANHGSAINSSPSSPMDSPLGSTHNLFMEEVNRLVSITSDTSDLRDQLTLLTSQLTAPAASSSNLTASFRASISESAHDALKSEPKHDTPYENPYPEFYPQIVVHSGIPSIVTLQAVDQFAQIMADERSFPISMALSHQDQECIPTQCNNVSLANIGNSPVMANGQIQLEMNFVLWPTVDPHETHYVNLTLSYTGIPIDSPMNWLRNIHLTLGLEIRSCPIGHGFGGNGGVTCQPCPYASYNLNGDGVCVSCASQPKLQCYGSTLMTDEDYWIYMNKTTNRASAHLCPSGYCRGKSSDCAPHRTGITCADCEAGYHESLLSACTKCEHTNWFLVILAFFFLWALILVIHMIIAVSSGKSTILFYFVQTAALFVSDIPFPWGGTNHNSSICIFPMTPLSRRALFVLVPIIMLVQIIATFGLYWIYMRFIRPLLPTKYQFGTPIGLDDEDRDATKPLLVDYDEDLYSRKTKDRKAADALDIAPKSSLERVDSFSSVEPSYSVMGLSIAERSSYSRPNLIPKVSVQPRGQPPASQKSLSDESSVSDDTESSSSSSDSASAAPSRRSGGSGGSDDSLGILGSPPDSEGIVIMPRTRERMVLLGEERRDPSTLIEESDDSAIGTDFDISDREDPEFAFDNDALVSEDDIIVPTFGFELSEEEESETENLEAELLEWTITPDYKARHTGVIVPDDIVFHSNEMANGPKTLGALRKWVQEKRFFHHYRLIRTVLAIASFTYSAATTFAFTMFDCVHIRHGPTFLKTQPSISCYSPEYRRWRLSLIALVPLMVSIFAVIAWKLISGHLKGKLNQADVRFGLLYEMYKPRFFFWKIIELFRRAALTGIFVFINEQAITRGLTLSGACFVILVAQALAWPYRRKLENSLETLSTFVLSVISIASIWHVKDSSSVASIIIWILIFVTTFIIMVAFAVSTLRKRIIPTTRRWISKFVR